MCILLNRPPEAHLVVEVVSDLDHVLLRPHVANSVLRLPFLAESVIGVIRLVVVQVLHLLLALCFRVHVDLFVLQANFQLLVINA